MAIRPLLACSLAVAASVAWVPLARSGQSGRGLPEAGYDRWSAYGGGNRQIRYSRLAQINRDNLHRLRVAVLRNGPQFTPPSLKGTVLFPGFDGGGQWGGAAFDPESGRLYVNSSEMAWILRLVKREAADGPFTARQLYRLPER